MSKKKVTFAAMADVFFVDNPTEQEANDCWYSRDEIKEFRSDIVKTIYVVRGRKFDPKKHCTRGLESFLLFGKNRKSRRSAAVKTILHVQEHNRDPMALSSMSRYYSKLAIELATKRAYRDHMDAYCYCTEDVQKDDTDPRSLKRKSLLEKHDSSKRQVFPALDRHESIDSNIQQETVCLA
jgi:hypothetical protein